MNDIIYVALPLLVTIIVALIVYYGKNNRRTKLPRGVTIIGKRDGNGEASKEILPRNETLEKALSAKNSVTIHRGQMFKFPSKKYHYVITNFYYDDDIFDEIHVRRITFDRKKLFKGVSKFTYGEFNNLVILTIGETIPPYELASLEADCPIK